MKKNNKISKKKHELITQLAVAESVISQCKAFCDDWDDQYWACKHMLSMLKAYDEYKKNN